MLRALKQLLLNLQKERTVELQLLLLKELVRLH